MGIILAALFVLLIEPSLSLIPDSDTSQRDTPTGVILDEELIPLVYEFRMELARRRVDIRYAVASIQFSKLQVETRVEGGAYAVCVEGTATGSHIWIHPAMRGSVHLRELLFHELGHCALGLSHLSRTGRIMSGRGSLGIHPAMWSHEVDRMVAIYKKKTAAEAKKAKGK